MVETTITKILKTDTSFFIKKVKRIAMRNKIQIINTPNL